MQYSTLRFLHRTYVHVPRSFFDSPKTSRFHWPLAVKNYTFFSKEMKCFDVPFTVGVTTGVEKSSFARFATGAAVAVDTEPEWLYSPKFDDQYSFLFLFNGASS